MPESEKKNKKNFLSWLLWWQVDAEELKKQVEQYDQLKITQSARGNSALLLLLSCFLTTVLILSFNWDRSAFFDVGLLLFLSFFVYKGHRWAIVGSMILWTFEKLYPFLTAPSNGSVVAGNPVVNLIWWVLYMHYLWLAFKVEQVRAKKAS